MMKIPNIAQKRKTLIHERAQTFNEIYIEKKVSSLSLNIFEVLIHFICKLKNYTESFQLFFEIVQIKEKWD